MLGLEPHQHDNVVKAVVYSVYEGSSDGVKQEQLASLTEVCVAGASITSFLFFHIAQCCVCYVHCNNNIMDNQVLRAVFGCKVLQSPYTLMSKNLSQMSCMLQPSWRKGTFVC